MPSIVVIALALGLHAQHQAGADQPAIADDAAGAAIAGGAAFLAAGQVQRVAQDVQHRFLRLAQELDRLAVDGGGDMMLAHISEPLLVVMPCARSNAMAAVRRASTPATLVR